MNELKKNDFFATLVKNQDLSITDLRDNGITPENSALLSKNDYKSMPQVQEAFKDDNGKFDEKKFNAAYDNAQILYAHFASDEFLGNVMENFTYSSDAWFAPKDANFRDDRPIILTNQRPADFSQGISYITKADYSATPELSIREQAQREKVVNSETGEELDYTPNDKAGLFSRFELPDLVLAQWDEDGTHIEDGIKVQHKAGDLKLNANYKPYYETLGNREIYNKELLRMSDVLTVDGSKWNKFDFFDSDDVHKSTAKTIANVVAKVAPMFLPYGIGEIYGYLGAADGIMRVMPVLGKAVNGLVTGTNDNALGHSLSAWEARAARHDPTQSDYAREHMFSLEGIGNMVSDVSKQLFQQRAISTIPSIYAKVRGIKDYSRIADVSKGLSLAYMAATSAQDVYSDFKAAGANDRTAGLGMLASTFALYKLMNIDYFRNNRLKDTFMDESEVREALRGASRETKEALEKVIGSEVAATTKGAAGFFNKVSDIYHNKLVAGLQKKGVAGLMNRGLSEGVEEVMEEVTTDLIKATTEGLGALGIPVTDDRLDFGWSARDFAQRYGTSFVGGFIGGMVFAGQKKYQKWLDSKLFDIPNVNLTDMQRLTYMIATGRRGEIDSYLDTWHNKGLLGSKELSIDGETKFNPDGTSEFIPSTKGMSQNDAIYNIIKNSLDNIQNAIEAEVPNPMAMVTEEGWQHLQTLGYDNPASLSNPRLLTASAIAALGDYSSFQNDLIKTLTDIVLKKSEIENKVKSLSDNNAKTEEERKVQADNIKNNAAITKLQDELKALREKKDKMFAGQMNKYYGGQAYFAANQMLQKPFVNLAKDDWVKLKYGRNYESMNDTQKKEVDEAYKAYTDKEGRNQVYRAFDLYLGLSQQYAPIIQQHGEELQKAYDENKQPASILGITDFVKAKEEWDTLKAEKQELEQGETTDESTARIVEITNKMQELSKNFSIMLRNPELAAITPGEENAINLFTGAADETTHKINIYDDKSAVIMAIQESTAVDSTIAGSIVEALRNEYQKGISENTYRFDNNELLGLFRGIAASYQRTGGARQRFQLYETTFPAEEDEMYNFRESIELNPSEETSTWTDTAHTHAYKEAIINAADNFIKNIGINNIAAQANFREILELLKANTRLMEPENEKELKNFLSYIIPQINGEALMDIQGDEVIGLIPEFDNYIQKSNNSPFLKLLSQLETDVNDLNLLQLIEQETLNLSTLPSLDDYLMQNDAIRDSLKAEQLKKTLSVAMTVIRGAADGTNDIINNFKIDDKDNSIVPLATMSDTAFKEFHRHYINLADRIDFLNAIANGNKNRSLRIHKATAINMRPKWIKAMLDLDESFKTIFEFSIQELWNETTDGATITPSEEEFNEWEKKVIYFEDALHEKLAINATQTVEIDQLATKLLSLVDVTKLYKAASTRLTDDKDQVIGEMDLIYHLATIASMPMSSFYAAYKDALDKHNAANPNNPIVPVYGQEYASKQIIAQAINTGLFNKILDKVEDKADYSEYKPKIRNYLAHKSRLHNLSVVLGSAGAGKTIGVIKNTLNTLTGSTDTDIAFIAGEDNQAKKVAASAGYDNNYWTVDTYCEKTFGAKVSDYINATESTNVDDNTGHWRAGSSNTFTGNGEIFNTTGFKILVIDEIETLSEPELQRICDNAEARGILVIGAGDLKQPGTDRTGVDLKGQSVTKSSGLEDCAFIKTPTLTTSMRPQTIAKVENTNRLSNALDAVLNESQTKPDISLDERANITKENLKKTDLYYYEDKKSGELSGDMGVGTQEAFEAKIEQLSKLDGTVAIISDNPSKYEKFKSDKIEIVPYEKRAGGEWDYVLVDVDFKKHCARGGNINAYLLTQDFYTLTQRSRKGTVIKTSDATNMFSFVPDVTKKQSISVNANQFAEFNEWRMKGLEDIESNEHILYDMLEQSPLMKGYDGKEPEITTTPPPPAQPTTPSPAPVNPAPAGIQQAPPSTPAQPVVKNNEGVTEPQQPIQQKPITETKESVKPEPKEKTETKPSRVLNNLFLKGENSVSSGKDLLNGIAEAFAPIKSEIRKIIRTNKKSITTIDDVVNGNPAYKREIVDLIRSKYGDPGVMLFEDIMKHPTGYSPSDGEKVLKAISELRMIAPKMSDHGRMRQRRKGGEPQTIVGDKIGYNDALSNILNGSEFYVWADQQNGGTDTYHSPIKVGIAFNRNASNDELKKTLTTIGSYVRTGQFNPRKLQEMLRGIAPKTLTDISAFIADTKLWLVPYTTGRDNTPLGLLVSRHYNKTGEFFDVPVMVISNPTIFGEYTGAIEVYRNLSLEKTPDEYLTIEEMETKYPDLRFNKQFGVVKATDKEVESGLEDLDEHSGEFVKRNKGKVFTTVTDEIALYDRYFTNKDGYGVYRTSDDGMAMLDFGRYERTGLQCRVGVNEFLQALKEYRALVGLSKEFDWNDHTKYRFKQTKNSKSEELTETASSKVIQNINLLKTDKGGIRQLLPWKRSGQLISIAAATIDSVSFALHGFMRAKNDGEGGELHTMILPYNNNFIEIALINNEYRVGTYNGKNGFTITTDPKLAEVKVSGAIGANGRSGYINLEAIFTALYGEDWRQDPPVIHLRNYYVNKKGNVWQQDFSYNWEMATMLASITDNKIDQLESALRSIGKVHGIFLDDHAMYDTKAPDTYWGILGAEGRTYETDHTKISNSTQYVININSQNVKPSEVTTTTTTVEQPITKPSLQSFLDSNHLGIKAETIHEANLQLENKAKDWRNQYIEETIDGYIIKTRGNENFINWAKLNYKIDYDWLEKGAMDSFAEALLKLNNGDWTFDPNGGSIVAKVNGQLLFKELDSDLFIKIDRNATDFPKDYIIGKVFDRPFNQQKLLDLIKSNLEIAEKIAIFEDQFEC